MANRDDLITPNLPNRAAIKTALLAEEGPLVEALIAKARFSAAERNRIESIATRLVEAARAGRRESDGIDSFLHEYGLSSEEGILLLCLAEALLRIPDAATADRLIAGAVGSGDWSRHLGRSDSVVVNASTWGLMLTGHIIDWREKRDTDLTTMVQRLIARSGEPVIRQALRQAVADVTQIPPDSSFEQRIDSLRRKSQLTRQLLEAQSELLLAIRNTPSRPIHDESP